MRHLPVLLATIGWIAAVPAYAQEVVGGAARWPQFRGPEAAGVAPDGKALPVTFGPTSNVLWKTPVPPGHSSPCIWGGQVFLTAYTRDDNKLETLCLDRSNGRIRWRRTAPTETIETSHATGSPAVATPACDGESVFVYFGSYGLLCYDFDGTERWKKPLPLARTFQGNGTSPVISGDLLFLNREFLPEPCLMAVNRRTGEAAWKRPIKLASVAGPNNGYSTPVVWQHDGVAEIVVHSPTRVAAYDLKDGSERWHIRTSSTACTTPTVGGGFLFVSGHFVGTEPGESEPFPSFDDLLKRADKNGDGKVSRSELPDDMDLFRRPEATGLPGTALKLRFVFRLLDGNGDGQVGREEWDQFVRSREEFAAKLENGLLAIKPGGQGNATATHVAWREKRGLPEVPSPLFYRDRIYLVRDGGLAACLEAKTGRVLYRERLGAGGAYFASPVAGDGKVYAASRDGVVTVFAAGDALKILARNRLGESVSATPAPVDGKLYVRTDQHVYAFGE